jgi:uncharacterized protein (DUF1800 family)
MTPSQIADNATLADVAYLVRRATFGGSVEQFGDYVGQSIYDIVDDLISAKGSTSAAPSELAGNLAPWQKANAVRMWWYDRMAFGGAPLREKMVLFLHGHFTAEFAKIGSAKQLFDQNELFRQYAFGDLRALTHSVCVQPAMLTYLDNAENVKEQPNENFARELWELFLLGTGSYTQSEVVDSARAWTGHTIEVANGDPDTARYVFKAPKHDNGLKTIFGTTRAFDGPGIIDHTFDGPRRLVAARFFVTKLWRFFTGTNVNSDTRDLLADVLQAKWNLGDLMRATLTHNDFYTEKTREPIVRSPTEVIVDVMRATGLRSVDLDPYWFAGQMGQELFSPPSVRGWEGGNSWLSTSSFQGRVLFASHAAFMAETYKQFLADTTATPTAYSVETALRVFGLTGVSDTTRSNLERWLTDERAASGWATIRHLVMLVILSPEFQTA